MRTDDKLNAKQQLFCENFIKFNFNETKALTKSGYSVNYRYGSGAGRLLSNPKIVNYIEARKKQLLDEIGVNTYRVLKEIAAIAFADVRDFYKDGALKNIDKLSEQSAKALMCVDVFELFDNEGNKIGETKRLRTHDKLKALELLARYLNLFEKDNESSKPEINVYDVTLKLT